MAQPPPYRGNHPPPPNRNAGPGKLSVL